MKVEVDLGLCRSYAICVGVAPDVFELDDDGVLVVLRPDVATGDEDRMREAALACPTQAILLTDD
jgi:ferredoxin